MVLCVVCVKDSYAQEKRGGTFNPNAPPEPKIEIAPDLRVGIELETEYVWLRNAELKRNGKGDLHFLEPAFTLSVSYDPSEHFQAFAVGSLIWELLWRDDELEEDKVVVELEQAYVMFKNLWGERLAFQIGRQRFEDERQWLYDADLDAARAFILLPRFVAGFSFSSGGFVYRDLLRGERDEKINNFIAYLTYELSEEAIAAAYLVARRDRTGANESPIFIGIHSDGDITESLAGWLELAYVFGEDGDTNINGVGLDIGANYVFEVGLEPSVTLAYAFGSKQFQQTGLQGNQSDFNGAADFNYYGELFLPELSNMSIFTAGVGIAPTEESSVDLVYHYYRQTAASDEIRETAIETDPNGVDKELGNEIDLIFGYENEQRGWAGLLTFGYFIPGKAFGPEADDAFVMRAEISIQF